jgi:hypothetical protein
MHSNPQLTAPPELAGEAIKWSFEIRVASAEKPSHPGISVL